MSGPVMMHLTPDQVPAHLRGGYSGRKFKAQVLDRVVVPVTAGLWDGGSRHDYSVVRLADGTALPVSDDANAPMSGLRAERVVTLEPGMAVVRRSTFCGNDGGLTFYVHSNDAAKLLPAPGPVLSDLARVVLRYTVGRKASYNGQDRYAQMVADLRDAVVRGYSQELVGPIVEQAKADRKVPTREAWDAARAELLAAGLVNKAGAVTPAGRNARGADR